MGRDVTLRDVMYVYIEKIAMNQDPTQPAHVLLLPPPKIKLMCHGHSDYGDYSGHGVS